MLSSLHLPQALCALLLLCATTVAAQVPDGFEEAVNEGLREYQAGQYSDARTSFERAHALAPSARTLRALGMTAVELRRYTAARMELEAALVDTRQPLTEAQRAEVSQMLTWMGSTLAKLRVRVQPEAARILVDEHPGEANLLLEPGKHALRVEADGFAPSERRIELTAGEEQTVDIQLEPERLTSLPPLAPELQLTAANEPSAPVLTSPAPGPVRDQDDRSVFRQWWFWTAIGVAVVAGTTVAVVAASAKHDVPADPPGTKVLILRAGN